MCQNHKKSTEESELHVLTLHVLTQKEIHDTAHGEQAKSNIEKYPMKLPLCT